MKSKKQLLFIITFLMMILTCNIGYCKYIEEDWFGWDNWITITPQKVEEMIKNGANVNAVDDERCTPLMRAASRSTPEVIDVLIKHGAYVNAEDDKMGWTPIIYAAVANPNPFVIETLIKHGAKVNAKNTSGVTALMYATHNKNPKIVETLIKYGADVNAKDGAGQTAIMTAIFAPTTNTDDKIEILKILIQHGADVNIKSDFGTAISFANQMGTSDEIIKLLKKYGAK